MPKPKLTAKQAKFIDEYFIDLNATQAAIRAGYAPKNAKMTGCQNLSKSYLKEIIDKRKAELKAKTEITQEYVAKRYKQFERFDVRRLLDKKGNPLAIHLLDEETAKTIQGFEIIETTSGSGKHKRTTKRYKYKLVDRKGANDSLSKLLGLNEPERKEVSVEGLTVEIINYGDKK